MQTLSFSRYVQFPRSRPSIPPSRMCRATCAARTMAETLFKAGVAQHNQIVKCRHCGLMYSNPRKRPADQDLVKDYDPDLTPKRGGI